MREFGPAPHVIAEKAKVLQILVNLIRNAKYSCDDGGPVEKILTLRICEDAEGRMNLSVLETDGGVLVVSQFTLYGDVRRGPEPVRNSAEHFRGEWLLPPRMSTALVPPALAKNGNPAPR